MKTTRFALITACIALACTSTINAQNVSYTTDFNDPNSVRPLKVYLHFLNMEGFSLGTGLGAAYSPFNRLLIDGQFRMTYWDALGSVDAEKVASEPIKSFKPYFEGGVNYFFRSKIKEGKGKAKITLASSYNSEKFIKIRCDKRRMIGLRGGAMYYNALWNFKEGGTVFKSSDGNLVVPPDGKYYSVATNSIAAYMGITTRKTKHVVASVSGYGGRRWFSDSFLFADFIIGATSMSEINHNGQVVDIDGTAKANIGFRAGMQVDQRGVVTRIEGGLRPNVGMGQPYFLFSFVATLYGNERKRKNKD